MFGLQAHIDLRPVAFMLVEFGKIVQCKETCLGRLDILDEAAAVRFT